MRNATAGGIAVYYIIEYSDDDSFIRQVIGRTYLSNMLHAGVRADAESRITETCAANIARFRSESDRSRLHNHSSLSELFISFLAKV